MYSKEFDYLELDTTVLISNYQDKKIEDYCKECPLYNKKWSCPPFQFEVHDYINRYDKVLIIIEKISYSEDLKNYSIENQKEFGKLIIQKEKLLTLNRLFELEDKYENTRALSAGTCDFCGDLPCSRTENKKCRHPEYLRYSLEALGIDLVKLLNEKSEHSFQWTQDGSLPDYHLLIFGLLIK